MVTPDTLDDPTAQADENSSSDSSKRTEAAEPTVPVQENETKWGIDRRSTLGLLGTLSIGVLGMVTGLGSAGASKAGADKVGSYEGEEAPNGVIAESPNGVLTLDPDGAIDTTGTWDLATVAGDKVYVAGMRGIDPDSNTLVEGPKKRIRQAFENMELIADAAGASLRDTTRIVVYVTDMYRYRPLVNEVQEEMWDGGPYPPRTIIEVDRLNQDDICEVEGTFYAPRE
jgi:enamine deaminase RidA (YjgF/YER057c/UK114 family)